MLSRLIERRPELDDTWSIYLTKPSGFIYTAGDYTELELEYPPAGGRRWFSLSSAPFEEHLRITFRLPEPHSEFKSQLMKLEPGGEVQLAPAMGNFNLPKTVRPVLLIALGIGVTPYRSMISQLNNDGRLRNWDIKLLHAAASHDRLFGGDFAPLKENYLAVNPSRVRLDQARILKLVADVHARIIFFAGPQTTILPLYDEFLASDWPRPQLRLSYFEGY